MSPYNNQPNRKHLFLTGPKQIGKSTALRRLLEGRDMDLGGFRTVRIFVENGGIFSCFPQKDSFCGFYYPYFDEQTQEGHFGNFAAFAFLFLCILAGRCVSLAVRRLLW